MEEGLNVDVVPLCKNMVRLDRIYISHSLRPKLSDSSIIPVGFTDHHLITATLTPFHKGKTSSYWHFNNELLQDSDFCQQFRFFWENWRSKKGNFSSLSQWWEVGKAQIRFFCHQCTAYSTARVKAPIQKLEGEIRNCEIHIDVHENQDMLGQKK